MASAQPLRVDGLLSLPDAVLDAICDHLSPPHRANLTHTCRTWRSRLMPSSFMTAVVPVDALPCCWAGEPEKRPGGLLAGCQHLTLATARDWRSPDLVLEDWTNGAVREGHTLAAVRTLELGDVVQCHETLAQLLCLCPNVQRLGAGCVCGRQGHPEKYPEGLRSRLHGIGAVSLGCWACAAALLVVVRSSQARAPPPPPPLQCLSIGGPPQDRLKLGVRTHVTHALSGLLEARPRELRLKSLLMESGDVLVLRQLQTLRRLSLVNVHPLLQHPDGWIWLGQLGGLTRLSLLGCR